MISRTFSADDAKLKELLMKELKSRSDKVLQVVAKSVYDVSQIYVPVDTGNLQRCSGIEAKDGGYAVWYNTEGSVRKRKPVLKDYAVYVENIDRPHKNGKRAHFLRDATIAVLGAIGDGGVL